MENDLNVRDQMMRLKQQIAILEAHIDHHCHVSSPLTKEPQQRKQQKVALNKSKQLRAIDQLREEDVAKLSNQHVDNFIDFLYNDAVSTLNLASLKTDVSASNADKAETRMKRSANQNRKSSPTTVKKETSFSFPMIDATSNESSANEKKATNVKKQKIADKSHDASVAKVVVRPKSILKPSQVFHRPNLRPIKSPSGKENDDSFDLSGSGSNDENESTDSMPFAIRRNMWERRSLGPGFKFLYNSK